MFIFLRALCFSCHALGRRFYVKFYFHFSSVFFNWKIIRGIKNRSPKIFCIKGQCFKRTNYFDFPSILLYTKFLPLEFMSPFSYSNYFLKNLQLCFNKINLKLNFALTNFATWFLLMNGLFWKTEVKNLEFFTAENCDIFLRIRNRPLFLKTFL